MTMKKKGLAAILALVLCLCFAGYALAEDIAPVEAAPVEAAPVEAAPVEAAPVEVTPVEEVPVEAAPVEAAPVEEVPVEEAPVEVAPVEAAPVEAAPVEEVPVEAAPVEAAPVEEVPVEAAPAEEAPIEGEPVEAAPVEPAPGETQEGDIIEIEDEETPLGVGGNTASVLPQGGEVPGVPSDPFTAKVRVEMLNGADIYFGDTVTLAAIVEGASAEYTIRWEYSDGGAWVTCGAGERYSFVVDEVNAFYTFRAVAVEKDGLAEIPAA